MTCPECGSEDVKATVHPGTMTAWCRCWACYTGWSLEQPNPKPQDEADALHNAMARTVEHLAEIRAERPAARLGMAPF